MNDKRIKHTGLIFLSAFLLSSCTQEDLADHDLTNDESEILFFTSVPGVETRSYDNIDLDRIKKNGFNVAAASLDNVNEKGDTIPVGYFPSQLVTQTPGMGEAYRSASCRWPSNKDNKDGKLRFFAFFPSVNDLKKSAGLSENDDTHFKLEYTPSNNTIEYWMRGFKVNKDITQHSDFVTATVEGSKTDNLYSGINLTFQHHLSGLYFEAFGDPQSYEVEIAGVRVGGIALESDFSFQGISNNLTPQNEDWRLTKVGRWTGVNQKKGCVEYIFQEGDKVVLIGKENYKTKEESANIMGRSGCALVIPLDYTVWTDYKNNKNNNIANQKLYFSVLLRVKEKLTKNNTLLYPYIEGANLNSSVIVTEDNMKVVYLSVERSTGKIKHQVYRKTGDKKFYTDKSYSKEYITPENEEIRNYGWASCIPSTTTQRWNPGFQYIYKLDYTNGVGVQDPEDAMPGKPIIAPIEVTGSQSATWHTVKDYTNKVLTDEDFNFTIE